MRGEKTMFYVTMSDKFLSGWGKAEGRIAKFVVECKTYEQAETIEQNAKKREEMKYINITTKKPYYNTNRYIITIKKYDSLGNIWKK